MSQIPEVIKDFIIEKFFDGGNPDDLDFETPLIRNEIIDSLGIFVLVAFLNERFAINITAGDVVMKNFETVQAIARVVDGKLGES